MNKLKKNQWVVQERRYVDCKIRVTGSCKSCESPIVLVKFSEISGPRLVCCEVHTDTH
jgi:hypothetical protein